MFRNWGFLLGEIWILLILAALIGLLAGWIVWGRRAAASDAGGLSAALNGGGEVTQLRADLERCRALHTEKDDRIAALEAAAAETRTPAPSAPADAMPVAVAAPPAPAAPDFDGDGLIEGTEEGTRPATLDAPRDGAPDDLKRIRGIGLKLEQLCHRLGFYHFDQIAAWSDDEVAWVDANLEGFKGRVTRDAWVDQARLLAGGGETAFSKRVDGGGMYEA
ncbi:MAG: hypothetical protein ACU0CO_02030 [Shimia sp.]